MINYDLPNMPESYVHRIGRTARAGADGVAISFCDREEAAFLRDIEKLIKQAIPSTNRRTAGHSAERPAHEQRGERPAQQRRGGRPGHQQRSERPAHPDRGERPAQAHRSERAAQPRRPEQSAQPPRPERSEATQWAEGNPGNKQRKRRRRGRGGDRPVSDRPASERPAGERPASQRPASHGPAGGTSGNDLEAVAFMHRASGRSGVESPRGPVRYR